MVDGWNAGRRGGVLAGLYGSGAVGLAVAGVEEVGKMENG